MSSADWMDNTILTLNRICSNANMKWILLLVSLCICSILTTLSRDICAAVCYGNKDENDEIGNANGNANNLSQISDDSEYADDNMQLL